MTRTGTPGTTVVEGEATATLPDTGPGESARVPELQPPPRSGGAVEQAPGDTPPLGAGPRPRLPWGP
jgi:hypothetical protein